MIIAISGTPGTGKTSVANILRDKGFNVIDINKLAVDRNLLLGYDKKRDSIIVDIDKIDLSLNDLKNINDIIFIEGHLSHLLQNVDYVILLRAHPKRLRENLKKRDWAEKKIEENVQAETLDIILCESVDVHDPNYIIEIDCSDINIDDVAKIILKIINDKFQNIKKYKIGSIDWSEEIFDDF
jgi:adenylate kinase